MKWGGVCQTPAPGKPSVQESSPDKFNVPLSVRGAQQQTPSRPPAPSPQQLCPRNQIVEIASSQYFATNWLTGRHFAPPMPRFVAVCKDDVSEGLHDFVELLWLLRGPGSAETLDELQARQDDEQSGKPPP